MSYAISSDIPVFDNTSASSYTSAPFRVGDFSRIVGSLDTDDGGASRFTFQGSNDPSANTWFQYGATVTARGLFDLSTLTTPPKFVRCLRSSLDSNARVWLHCRTP